MRPGRHPPEQPSIFPMSSRSFVERDLNVVHWTDMDRAGHFAALECLELPTDGEGAHDARIDFGQGASRIVCCNDEVASKGEFVAASRAISPCRRHARLASGFAKAAAAAPQPIIDLYRRFRLRMLAFGHLRPGGCLQKRSDDTNILVIGRMPAAG